MRTTNKRKIKYDTRFSQEDISQLSTAHCPTTVANRYDKRFNGYDIINLFKLECMPKEANAYDKMFNAEEVSLFCWTGCRPKRVNKCDIRFTGYEVYNLIKRGYRPELSNKYDRRFNKEEVLNFLFRWAKPEIVNEYDKRFNAKEILDLYKRGCRPEITNKYDKRFSIDEILDFLFRAKHPPEIVNEYNKRFNAKEILHLIRFGCSAETSNEYIIKGFETNDLLQLFRYKRENKLGTISEFIHSFESDEDSRFDITDCYALYEAGCSHQEAKEYNPQFSGLERAILYEMGLKPDRISSDKQEQLFKLFRKMAWLSKKEKNFKKFSFLGTGVSGIVLLKGHNVCKFSEKINKEYELLKKIQDRHKGNQTNVIRLKDKPKGGIALEIEYVQGDSLENILQKKSSKLNLNSGVILRKPVVLPQNKVLKYGFDIINGLIEMRQAGVWYHRDIRPSNIIIDEENDRAIIIDFGIASTDKKALPKNNRRYGGANDLISLSQVLYRMATGRHIFAKSKSMDRTTYAQKIKDYRDEVYSDRTGELLKKHLEQVDETIQDEQLRILIKTCLTAKNYHYKKTQRMMAKLIPNNGQ